MGFLKNLFKKTDEPQPGPVMEFIQSEHFRGFMKFHISNYGYDEAQNDLRVLQSVDSQFKLTGQTIRLEFLTCSTKTDALAIFVDDLRIGTIFFSDGNYEQLRKSFISKKISAAHVKIQADGSSFDTDLLVKLEE